MVVILALWRLRQEDQELEARGRHGRTNCNSSYMRGISRKIQAQPWEKKT
jgi:hypothetical protein